MKILFLQIFGKFDLWVVCNERQWADSVIQNSREVWIFFLKYIYLLSYTISGKIIKKQAFNKELNKQV